MNNKNNAGKLIISLPIIIAVFLFFSANILNIKYDNEKIKISGLYGANIKVSDMEEITLKDTMPKIIKGINTLSFGNTVKKGYFKLEDNKCAQLYIYNENGPFIYFKVKAKSYYINLENSEDTKELYYQIISEKQ